MLDDYTNWLFENTSTANGVWGGKVTWPHLQALVHAGKLPHEAFGFPLLYIFLDRLNHTAQAISEYRAMCTGKFHSNMSAESPPPVFNFEHIQETYTMLAEERKNLTSWLHDIPHLSITYEALVAAPQEVVSTIAHVLDVELTQPLSSDLTKMASAEDFVWELAFNGLHVSTI